MSLRHSSCSPMGLKALKLQRPAYKVAVRKSSARRMRIARTRRCIWPPRSRLAADLQIGDRQQSFQFGSGWS